MLGICRRVVQANLGRRQEHRKRRTANKLQHHESGRTRTVVLCHHTQGDRIDFRFDTCSSRLLGQLSFKLSGSLNDGISYFSMEPFHH